MNSFWHFYLIFGIYTIPITIILTVVIVQEILDFILNKRKVEQMLIQADNISFENIIQSYTAYLDKLKSIDEWTQKELEVIVKNRELDEKEKKAWRKREKDDIYWEKEHLIKDLIAINEKYWVSRWKYQKTIEEINQEIKFRKLFLPD
jgi:hypothetical protein